jgi:hypothetical protein
MGIKTSGDIFSAMMARVLDDPTLRNNMVIYLDNIVIFSQDFDTHLDLLKRLFTCLEHSGLKLHHKKSEFLKESIVFVGHRWERDGYSVPLEKLTPILNFLTPTSKATLRSYLGMCSYLRSFVKDLSTNVVPFLKLLKKEVKFVWGKDQQDVFATIQELTNFSLDP